MRLEYLRAGGIAPAPGAASGSMLGIGVDMANKVIRGAVIAEIGLFKTPGRGQFDQASLNAIARLMRVDPRGVRSRFTHPAFTDSLGTFLGRMKNPRVDGGYVRADLVFCPSAFVSPLGDLGTYILTLARSDPSSFGSSLVLEADREAVKPARGSSYYPPPIWRPTAISASDLVGEGDAVHHGLLPPLSGSPDDDALLLADIERDIAKYDLDNMNANLSAELDLAILEMELSQ